MRLATSISVIAFTLPLLLSSCNQSSEAGQSPGLAGALTRHEATRVRVLPAVRREMRSSLETTTVVESERSVVVHPQMSGVVMEILVEEGDSVEKGAVLARLDQRDTTAQLQDTRIALKEAQDSEAKGEIAKRDAEGQIQTKRLAFEQAKRGYERNQQAGLISALELEKLKLEMDTADMNLEAAILAKDRAEIEGRAAATAVERAHLMVERTEVTHSYTVLSAPFAGVIAKRGMQVGDNVSGATEAFSLTDLTDLRTTFYRPQRELGLFAGLGAAKDDGPGGIHGFAEIEVSATSEALPGHIFTGHIERISPEIDAASGSFRVTVRLEEESGGFRLLPGMLLRVSLVTERHVDALAVSKRALRREGDATILFVAEDGKARRVVVQEGFGDDEYIEVEPLGGAALDAGMDVIVVGNRDLEDGKEIEIAPWDDEAESAEEEPESEAVKSSEAEELPAEPVAPPAEEAPPADDPPANDPQPTKGDSAAQEG